jgi:hypothetical protein
MFGWFKKAPPELPSVDRVYLDEGARMRALLTEAARGPTLLAAPFPDDEDTLAGALAAAGLAFTRVTDLPRPWGEASITLVRAAWIGRLVGRAPEGTQALVYGHFPHPAEDRALREGIAAHVSAAPVYYSALDEPLVRRFGGEHTAEVVRGLGLGPDEAVEHVMVTNALARARERVGKQVTTPLDAPSAAAWLDRNLG